MQSVVSDLAANDGSHASASRTCPLPASMSVLAARDVYLAENGFTVEGYEDPYTPASFFGIRFSVPNTPRHRAAIKLHDLHHVATGYGTDLAGEAEISAWEARRGLRELGPYVGSIVFAGALMGLAIAPRRTVRAWRASGHSRPAGSLFQSKLEYEQLVAMSVAELRTELRVAANGIAQGERALHAYAP